MPATPIHPTTLMSIVLKGTTIPILEHTDGGTSSLILREGMPAYRVEDADWRRELEALEEVWIGGGPAGDRV